MAPAGFHLALAIGIPSRPSIQDQRIALELATEGDAATASESLSEIVEDLGELERIVEDVLTATRLSLRAGVGTSSAAPPIRLQLVDVRQLLEKAAARFRAIHLKRALVVSVAGDLPAITVDPVLLRRVVDNLLDNANKYTDDPASEVVLAAASGPETVTIEVRDLGGGIAPADLTRVFEPFFRADPSRNKLINGLGLTLARRIVEAHGGSLTIESVVGSGTCARLELPTVNDPFDPQEREQ